MIHCLKDNKGTALVMAIGVIAVTSLLGMFAMGVALKSFQRVQNVKEEQKTYYEEHVYIDSHLNDEEAGMQEEVPGNEGNDDENEAQ